MAGIFEYPSPEKLQELYEWLIPPSASGLWDAGSCFQDYVEVKTRGAEDESHYFHFLWLSEVPEDLTAELEADLESSDWQNELEKLYWLKVYSERKPGFGYRDESMELYIARLHEPELVFDRLAKEVELQELCSTTLGAKSWLTYLMLAGVRENIELEVDSEKLARRSYQKLKLQSMRLHDLQSNKNSVWLPHELEASKQLQQEFRQILNFVDIESVANSSHSKKQLILDLLDSWRAWACYGVEEIPDVFVGVDWK